MPGFPHPQSPAGSSLESFCNRTELVRCRPPPPGLRPCPLPANPTRFLPAAEARTEREGSSPYLGGAAGRAPARRLGPTPAPGGAWAEVGGTGRGARGQAQPWPGVAGPGLGLGARGLPLPGAGLSWLSSVARSGAGLSPRSTPFSRRGWAGAGITVTSPPFRSLSGDRSSRYVQSVYTVTKPAQPPRLRLTSRLRRVALSGPGGRSEFLAELASELLLFTATPPHAGTRTLSRTHFLDSAFSPERFGVQPSAPRGRTLPPRLS